MRLGLVAVFILLVGCQKMNPEFDPDSGAEFRFFAKTFASLANPVCPLTEKQKLLDDFAYLEKKWGKLKSDVSGTSLAIDMMIVESDEAYKRSREGVSECIGPDLQDSNRQINAVFNSMWEAMEKMDEIRQSTMEEA